ncbi:hypothetical protein Micbo1qcDRAFT_165329 [Microdochium bolleyi]|uniref:RNA polymerase II subunit A C-terminal domain phosphatase n=1 Tax=Microdochium bolleyi TaxID=196109 RepID=A0A136IW49_9PEZI|nr:hypothetical protein Micbo1qcDRAFT_165329 [Microdochium bolleyi]
MGKTLKLGAALSYPITITKILKNVGDDISKKEPVLQYSYKFKRVVHQEYEQDRVDIETGYADWDSPAEGKILKWRVKQGDVIESDQQLITIEEACSHEVQYAGLCAICGKDMKEANYASEQLDTSRATVAMVHDNVSLTVSSDQAIRAEMSLQKRLLKDRKLSLVVDLDQTIIHACIEPTVGEWQRDPENPNYEAVKEVRSFQLDDGPRGLASGCWYYIKMRPGLAEFLENIAELFELHVYTMGTRAYALNIAKIVDPTQKLFGNRVISRDENGSMTAKSLQRLFPVSTNMVVVIDDRADVWPQNRSNLIKVTPYDFFKGIGDINSSFLPKREDILAPSPLPELTAKPPPKLESAESVENSKSIAEHEKALATSSDETIILQLQAEEQERTLERQLTDRPLLHLQKQLDKEDEAAEKKVAETKDDSKPASNGDVDHLNHHHRHNLLRDDDQELIYLERHLANLHKSFFEQFDARATNHRADDIAPDSVPDAGKILTFLKSRVLRGTKIVLSGLVPIGADVRRTEIGLQAESFGTEISTRITSETTHLVISSSRPRTQKVQQAARMPHIKIVNQDWLADSIAQWKKLDERPYLIDVHPSDRAAAARASIGSGDGSTTPPSNSRITVVQSGQHLFEDEQGEDADEDDDDDDDGDAGFDDDEQPEDQDLSDVMPTELQDGEKSPGALGRTAWADMAKELEDELGSDLDDSDLESVDRGFDTDDESGKKRKYDSDDGDDGSLLAKKQRLAKTRTTGLRNVHNVGEDDTESNGLPTPGATGDDDEVNLVPRSNDADKDIAAFAQSAEDDDDDDIDGLEAELEAELAAAMDE